MASSLRGFTRMNPFTFYGSKVDKYPKEFIDKISKILLSMGLYTSEKVEFGTYQLKDVAQAWYVQWRYNMSLRGGQLTWEILKAAFVNRFFPWEMREEKWLSS